MLKTYEEMRKVDVSAFVEQRDGLDYLNWARCVDLLHENGAEKVYFTPLLTEKGSSLFMTDKEFKDKNGNTNQCYEVGVHIVIDDLEFDMRGPLMNAANPVKDNSLSQQRVWNCQTRLFVKGVAIYTGLGFNLWLKEEQALDTIGSKFDDMSQHNILTVKERIEQLITLKMDGGLTLQEIADKTKMGTDDNIRDLLKSLTRVYNFEGMLKTL
ncbi:hypothetical protein M2140_001954 [Clostridiales Family XIII bacterium PM5-7]